MFYARKACSNLWFLDRVRRSGVDIEVNSGGELWKARKAGFQPQQIGFNGNAKTRAEIAAATATRRFSTNRGSRRPTTWRRTWPGPTARRG